MLNKEELDLSRIPQHVAIIMDGNGRWAKLRGQERSYGHQAGAETVHVIAEEASKLGIKYLTLYTFSTENWNRPSNEVAALMALLFDSIEEETFMKNNISFRVIGDLTKLPDNVRERLETCIAHWPDFREAELHKAIHDYQKRERRFGKTSEQIR